MGYHAMAFAMPIAKTNDRSPTETDPCVAAQVKSAQLLHGSANSQSSTAKHIASATAWQQCMHQTQISHK